MTTPDASNSKPDNTPYIAAALIGLAVFWRWGDFTMALVAGLAGIAAVFAYQVGWLAEVEKWLRPQLYALWLAFRQWLAREPAGEYVPEPYEIYLGQIPETREHVLTTIQELGSFGIYAMTRSGKTSFLHSYIHYLILHHTPDELKFVISDLKNGLDFRIYRRLPHLAMPVAATVDESHQIINWLLGEMDSRAKLFKAIPPDKLCNSLDDYHRLSDQLMLGLPRLPIIIGIFDEFHNITVQNKTATESLTKVVKEGNAYGIYTSLSTQLPKADYTPTVIKAELTSKFIGFLADTGEYYKIADVIKEYWEPFHKMGKVKGRFIASVSGEVFFLQVNWMPRRQLEDLARQWSEGQDEPEWPEKYLPSETPAHPWSGSNAEKRSALIEWFHGFDEQPTFEEFRLKFHAGQSTYYEWVPPIWKELHPDSDSSG